MSIGRPDYSNGKEEAPSPRRKPQDCRLALGFERVGLLSLRFPWIAGLIVLSLSIAAAFGIARLKVDDSLSQLFRSDTAEFKQYEAVTRRFPSSEFDVLVVAEGKTLLERASLEALRNLVTDLQLVEGTRGVISLFSAREPPDNGKLPAALFPEPLPEGAEYDQLVRRVKNNEILRGKLLSEDGELALIVLALDPAIVAGKGLNDAVAEIRGLVAEHLAGTGLKGQLSGVPVMQLEIRNAVERDRLIYNAFGFAAGCLIAILFFRRVSFMIIAAAPPLVAILLSLGCLGWLDVRLNMFLNVMTPLIMVISFADSMQLTFAARDRLIAGEDKVTAFRTAVLVVGPACVLTHATAGLSFAALLFSSFAPHPHVRRSRLARDRHRLCGGSDARAFARHPAAAPGSDLRGQGPARRRRRERAAALLRLDRLPDGEPPRPLQPDQRAACGQPGVHLRHPRTPLSPRRSGARPRSGRDSKRSSRRQAHRRQPDRHSDRVPERGFALRARDARRHRRRPFDVERQAGVGNVWSIETLRRWLAEKAGSATSQR